MFVVKIKQDSSRHMVGDFTSLCMEELTAGSALSFTLTSSMVATSPKQVLISICGLIG